MNGIIKALYKLLGTPVIEPEDLVFYGPHLCPTCKQRMVCRTALQQGGVMFDYPEGIIYPNTRWERHICPARCNG